MTAVMIFSGIMTSRKCNFCFDVVTCSGKWQDECRLPSGDCGVRSADFSFAISNLYSAQQRQSIRCATRKRVLLPKYFATVFKHFSFAYDTVSGLIMWKLLLISLSLLNLYGECKWHSERRDSYNRDTNEISSKWHKDSPTPPDHTKLVEMARYVLHNSAWASIATISTLPAIEGFPFSNVKSIVDGSLANSTGIPYFYMSPLDFTARDLTKNSRATVLVSLEETRYCENKKWDPEDPRCTRLMLSGKMKKIKEGTPEYNFAKAALFERHPDMANYPPDHDWFVAKLKIAQIAMVDWFGGAKYVPVKDYLAFNYTLSLMQQRHTETLEVDLR